MPLPRPNKGENKKDFLSRCMGNDVMKKDFKENPQRIAVCYNQWKEHTKANKTCDRCDGDGYSSAGHHDIECPRCGGTGIIDKEK